MGGSLDSDPDVHKVIDITDDGLVPITGFILEENIKDKVEDYLNLGTNNNDMRDPYVLISTESQRNGTILHSASLINRFCNKISISI